MLFPDSFFPELAYVYIQVREEAVKVLLFTMFMKQPNCAVLSEVQHLDSSSVENLSDA